MTATIANYISMGTGALLGFCLGMLADRKLNKVNKKPKKKKVKDIPEELTSKVMPDPDFETADDILADLKKECKKEMEESASHMIGEDDDLDILSEMEEEEENQLAEDEEEEALRKMQDGPYIINVGEYYNQNLHYDKSVFTYYTLDDTLLDENDEIVDDREALIGHAAIDRFHDDNDEPDIVYVRNDKISTDYEIMRVEKEYNKVFMGEDDTE